MNNPLWREKQTGILEELLKTPVFKDIIRSGARSLAHGSGGSLVKAVMGRDPEVFLNLAAAAPALANILIRACAELGEQLKNQYPPETLSAFLESLLGDIDTSSLERCGRVWKGLLGSLLLSSPDAARALEDRVLSSGPVLTAQGIDALARALNSLEERRPGALSSFTARTLARIDRTAASSALGNAAGAILDQKWHVFSWLFGFVRARIKKRFGS